MLITKDFLAGDSLVEVVGIDDGLAFDLEAGELSFLGQAVEGGGPDLEQLAYLLTGVHAAGIIIVGGLIYGGFVQDFADDGFKDAAENIHDGFYTTHGYSCLNM